MPVRQAPGEVLQLPQGFAEIDRNHPLGARVIGWLLPGASSSGRSVSNIGTVDVGAGPFGCHIKGNNARMQSDAFQTTGLEYPFTLVVVANRLTRTANGNVIAGLGNTGGNQICGFQLSTSSNNRLLYRNVNGGSDLQTTFSANATTSGVGPVVLGATITSAIGAVLYWNGVADTGSNTSGTSGTPAMDKLALGGIDRGTDLFADTGNDIAGIIVFAGALSAAEHASIAANPAQVFADDVWEVVAGAAGGGTDYPVTRTESADASDTASLTIIYAATASEIADAVAAQAAAMAAAVSIDEVADAASTQTGALTAFVSIAEAGAATDSASTAGLYGVTVAEASDAADVASAIRALFGTTSETGAATDTSSASLPGMYSVTVVEAANAEDEAAQAMSALVVIAEALAAADVANWVGAVIYTRAPRGGGYPATVPTTERYGTTNTKRPAMTNTRR